MPRYSTSETSVTVRRARQGTRSHRRRDRRAGAGRRKDHQDSLLMRGVGSQSFGPRVGRDVRRAHGRPPHSGLAGEASSVLVLSACALDDARSSMAHTACASRARGPAVEARSRGLALPLVVASRGRPLAPVGGHALQAPALPSVEGAGMAGEGVEQLRLVASGAAP